MRYKWIYPYLDLITIVKYKVLKVRVSKKLYYRIMYNSIYYYIHYISIVHIYIITL